MTTEQETRLDQLFHAALALEFAAQVCGSDILKTEPPSCRRWKSLPRKRLHSLQKHAAKAPDLGFRA